MNVKSAAAVVIPCLLLSSCFLGPPRPYEIESEEKSQDGRILASVTRQAYGGAAGGVTCEVFLTEGEDADLSAEPVAQFVQECPLKLRWVDSRVLVVQYSGYMTQVWKFRSWRWFGDAAGTQY